MDYLISRIGIIRFQMHPNHKRDIRCCFGEYANGLILCPEEGVI
ncbi:MAG: hypothetical protein SGI87_00510 [Flavobacteriales bacterium]|nr:hypothetical protein [Flavobacteriales bacterium]